MDFMWNGLCGITGLSVVCGGVDGDTRLATKLGRDINYLTKQLLYTHTHTHTLIYKTHTIVMLVASTWMYDH